LILFRIWQLQHIRTKHKNKLASLILWLFKITELHPPPPQKITKNSTAKEQIAKLLHSLRVMEKSEVSLLVGLIGIIIFKQPAGCR
jgi:hypothetical protein